MRTLRILNTADEILHVDVFAGWDGVIARIINEANNGSNICDHNLKIQLCDNTNIRQSFNIFNKNEHLRCAYNLMNKRHDRFKCLVLVHDDQSDVDYYNNNEEIICMLNNYLQDCCHIESMNIEDMADEELIYFAEEINIVLQTNNDNLSIRDEIIQQIRNMLSNSKS